MDTVTVKELIDKFDLNLNVPEWVLQEECKNYKNYTAVGLDPYKKKIEYTFSDGGDLTMVLYVYDESYECGPMDEVYEIIAIIDGWKPSSRRYNITGEEILPPKLF